MFFRIFVYHIGIQIVVYLTDAPSKNACHSERSVSGVEESTHFRDICSKISAKILRLPSVAQDDTLFLLLFKLQFKRQKTGVP